MLCCRNSLMHQLGGNLDLQIDDTFACAGYLAGGYTWVLFTLRLIGVGLRASLFGGHVGIAL